MCASPNNEALDQRKRLIEKFNNEEWTVTAELSTPRRGDLKDNERYEKHLKRGNDLTTTGVLDALTLRDAPSFHPILAEWLRPARSLTKNFKSECGRKLRAGLTEIQSRQATTEAIAPDNFFATIAAQTHSQEVILTKLDESVNQQGAIAAFAVSGGDPRRRLALWLKEKSQTASNLLSSLNPVWFSAEMNAIEIAKLVQRGKEEGRLPDDLMLWGAWDHMKEPTLSDDLPLPGNGLHYLEQKIEHGITTFLTNPPFIESQFEGWLEEIENRKFTNKIQIKVGVPYLLSVDNILFWHLITGVNSNHPEARGTIEAFKKAERDNSLKEFRKEWNKNWTLYLSTLPGVTGMHFMASAFKEGSEVLKEVQSDMNYRATPPKKTLRIFRDPKLQQR